MNAHSKQTEFIGYDLGHGETSVARAYAGSSREPEIIEYAGEKSFVSAVARTKGARTKGARTKGAGNKTGVRIGAQAVNISAFGSKDTKGKNEIWLKFKSRDLNDKSTEIPTRLFTQTLFEDLSADKKIDGLKTSRFIVGCPSGWDANDRDVYRGLMQKSGLGTVRIVPESRAALMTALEQGYLSLEAARSSVLIVDIGSSTTDFTYCYDLEAEDVGHNILGSGLLDTLILELNLQRQPERMKIEKLIAKYPWYRPIMEYWCRLAKEQYFNGAEKGQGAPVEIIRRLPVAGGVLFEIRMDSKDADSLLKAKIKALNGFSWPETFNYALRESVDRLGGRTPQTVLLTGGASRLPLVGPACEKAFPGARVVRGAEPEFAIARGLSWLGRFEYLHDGFKSAIGGLVKEGGPVFEKARFASDKLGDVLAPVLVDALIETCVIPAFSDWRRGEIKALNDVEKALNARVSTWLSSHEAKQKLRPAIEDWFSSLQRQIEQITDPLCRDHNLPAMVLSLDDSTHVSKHLEGLSVAAPKVSSLENDTALVGTTISAVLIGVLLAEAHLLAPLLGSPIGIAIGGVLGLGSFVFGKKTLEGKLRAANVPGVMRMLMTDGRVRKAAKRQRKELIRAVANAWNNEASEQFADELVETLYTAFIQSADERAVLFLL